MGQVVGESAAKVDVPKTTPIRPQDLMATVFHVLGIDRRVQFVNQAGRPIVHDRRRQADRGVGLRPESLRTALRCGALSDSSQRCTQQ